MKTKEEICKEQTGTRPMPMKDIYAAMDEYSGEVAVAFVKWCNDNKYTYTSYAWFHDVPNEPIHNMSTSYELFNLFIKETQTTHDKGRNTKI